MDYYLNLINTIGIHTLLGLSAYLLILTGQVSICLLYTSDAADE